MSRDYDDGLDPTERLLVKLSRVRPEPETDATDFAGVELDRFLFLAERLGNFNLLARRLVDRHPGLDEAAPGMRSRVERNLDFADLRERFGIADVRDLALALAERGEPLLLLKGGAYNRFIYPRRGLRSFVDLDVLVRPSAVEPALAKMASLGYAVVHRIEGSVDLTRRLPIHRMTLNLEIHTDLVHHYQYPYYKAELVLSEERLLARAEARELDGARVLVLGPEDELVYSVLHFLFHHDLVGLKYHSDVSALLTDPARPLDVAEAVSVAKGARARWAVGLALVVQERLFGPGAVPAALLRELRPRGLRRLAVERVVPPLARLPLVQGGRVAGHPAKALLAPGLAAPIGLAVRWLFPGRSYLRAFYQLAEGSWHPAYHLRYASHVLANAVKRLRHQAAAGREP